MALNQTSPAYRRSKCVSCADPFFNQVVIKESDHREVLLQRCIRQCCSHLSFALSGTLSDMLDVSTNHVTKNRLKLNASRRQKSQKRIEITSVSIKRVRC